MNYDEYDRIQAKIGGIGGSLRSDINEILTKSKADEETKELLANALTRVSKSIDELASELSKAMEVLSK